jgi:type IV secretion system protein VirB9
MILSQPSKIRVLAAVIAFFMLGPLPGFAETVPLPGNKDRRVTYATFTEGQVYAITTRLRTVTLIELGDGEKIQSVAIGDLESFKIDRLEGQNLFILKPVIAGASTNVTVETNQHIYFFFVTETSRGTPNFSVKFTVPGNRAAASTGSEIPASLPMTYKILKRRALPEFTPVGISDDGRKTYFDMPPGAAMPTVFRADAEGREYSVNAAVNGTRITVSTRSARWVLRYGDAYVCIEGK